ncbi:MAG: methyltransferase domain-containing protein [Actinobacteria bacterium]|nr:methyltransferase domain-containing protein [Actinomycetota bacterium]
MSGATDDLSTYHKDHWVEIEPDRFERYDQLFRIDPRFAERMLGPVGVQPGETVVDFGCGPGYVAVELARLGGPGTTVHAVDVNADFVERARVVVGEAQKDDAVTVHHVADERLPFADGSVDRVYAKNVLEYVPDLSGTLAELVRVLRPGGTLVASDSDFGFVVVEPLDVSEVREIFEAAAPAFKEPNVGRKLRNAYRRAGLVDVKVDVAVTPDTRGTLRGVIENMLGYGTKFGRMSDARAVELRGRLDAAIADGDFFMALPQWWVRGSKA